jgi:hypothetical protein
VDRRRAVRQSVDLSGSLSVPGQPAQEVRISDISEGGASVHGGSGLSAGATGNLRLDGGLVLPFVVRNVAADYSHLMFTPDAAGSVGMAAFLARLAARRVA